MRLLHKVFNTALAQLTVELVQQISNIEVSTTASVSHKRSERVSEAACVTLFSLPDVEESSSLTASGSPEARQQAMLNKSFFDF